MRFNSAANIPIVSAKNRQNEKNHICHNFAEYIANFVAVMAKIYFKSYIWLLETLQSRGPLTLAQIKDLWSRSSVNEVGSEPSNHRFLTDIIRAIRDERMLEVNYQGFTMDAPRDFLLEPFCLKEYKRRWYLFARKHGIDKEPHSFALDRMNIVTVSETSFTVPKSFAQTFFSTRYGVLQYEG